jgi:hypothetical protein
MKKQLKMKEKGLMISFYSLLLLLVFAHHSYTQNVAVNTTLAAANLSAGLDIDFTDKGFLISRVALTGTVNAAPLPVHVAGMLVYNTATTGDVSPGLYYNDGTKWVPTVPQSGTTAGTMQYWNGTSWVSIPVGQPGQKLQLSSTGIPAWSNGSLPTLTTTPMSLVTSTTASSGGNITSDGGTAVSARGVCWSTSSGPTILNSFTNNGAGSGSFTSNLTGLTTATTYYVRAYATNANGTSYGNEISFLTP